MITLENMTKDEIVDLLNRSWMTHDGMWFYHCFQECGVIYRLACWFDALGLTYRATPEIKACQMLSGDTCGGDFVFNFGQTVAS